MKAHFQNIEQVSILNNLSENKNLFVGKQPKRNSGFEATFASSEHHHPTRSAIVSDRSKPIFEYSIVSDEPTGRLALVFELMDMNFYEAIKGRRHYLPEQRVRYYMYQVLKSIDHMHRNGIFHRDIKPG